MRAAGLVLVALFSFGCGLLANGTTRYVPVRSTPTGAEVWVDGVYAGATPMRVRSEPDRACQIELRAPGRRPQVHSVEPRVEAVYILGDIVFTAGIGAIVDALTDGWDVPSPGALEVVLEPLPRGEAMPHPRPAPDAAPRLAPPTEGPPGAPDTPPGYGPEEVRHAP